MSAAVTRRVGLDVSQPQLSDRLTTDMSRRFPSDETVAHWSGVQRPPPPFDVQFGPARVTVRPHSSAETVGDLAAALELPRAAGLVVDGAHASAYETLAGVGMRSGSAVAPDGTAVRAPTDADADVELVVITGPGCESALALPPGRHIVGRSPAAAVRIDDAAVELHHGVLAVSADGSVTFRQLTGRVPVRIDGAAPGGSFDVPPGSTVSIGASAFVVRPQAEPTATPAGRLIAAPHDPWRRSVQRGPSPRPPAEAPTLRVPATYDDEAMPPATGLVAAGVAVVGAGAVALIMGQLLFALFAALGAVASVATWAVGVGSVCRRRRAGRESERRDRARFGAQLDAARAAAQAAHVDANPTVESALGMIDALDRVATTDLWRRRLTDAEALRAVLGRGTVAWAPPLDGGDEFERVVERSARLTDVPIPVELGEAAAVAIRGDGPTAAAVVRSVLVQLATQYGPADWRPIVVSRDPGPWRWAEWLPHVGAQPAVVDAADAPAVAAALEVRPGADARHVVLVVDDVDLFATRTGSVRRFIDVVRPATIAIVTDTTVLPAVCSRVLDVTAGAEARWHVADDLGDVAGAFRCAGISVATAHAASRGMAQLLDPEDDNGVAASIPTAVTLAEVDDVIGACDVSGTDAGARIATTAVVQRWAQAGRDPRPAASLGMSAEGPVELDLVADGPHALIAGTTGSGKSELLRTLVVGLALRCSPDHLTFVLVDYKGGSTFDACADLAHTVGTVTDLDPGLAERALVSLEAELHRRERLLRAVGATDLTEYRANPATDPLPRLVVVIDEFAALAKELPDFLAALVGVAQRGRSLGLHLILATQRPAGVVSDDIRANTNLRIALRLGDAADARDVVDDDAPTTIARTVPGRAVLRLGPEELVTFQAASCTGPVGRGPGRLTVERQSGGEPCRPATVTGDVRPTELAVAVAVVADAVRVAGIGRPHRPWIDPLPDHLPADQVDGEGGVIGLVDDPAAQCRRPLRWTEGNLALVGGGASGRTSTLVSLLVARCRAFEPEQFHCYVVDAHGDPAFDGLLGIAHCGGVVRINDVERVHRLLGRIVRQIDARVGTTPDDHPRVAVAFDGLTSLRTALATVDGAATLELLDRVLADGPAVGIVSCWSDDREPIGSAAPADVWQFGMADARGAGGAPSAVPGRVRVGSSGLVAQVALHDGRLTGLTRRPSDRGPMDVERLPERVRATTVLDAAEAGDRLATGPVLDLPIGVADDGLAVATLRVPRADHVFIGGAAMTGKTTALRQLSQAWRRRHPGGQQLFVDRHDPLTRDRLDAAAVGPVLVVVDDADRVDDVGATFASIISGEYPGVTIAAAARLEAVRASYGHWTRDVARSRCGLILTSTGEVDGDLLGVILPRRALIAARPGLGWVIDGRGQRLVQVAQHDVEFVGASA
ncbi:MAG: hypothetical protein HKN44_08570 [Ilumatobacter sp.]|nr:hypothetical protein [Ilumatobacter sp.]